MGDEGWDGLGGCFGRAMGSCSGCGGLDGGGRRERERERERERDRKTDREREREREIERDRESHLQAAGECCVGCIAQMTVLELWRPAPA